MKSTANWEQFDGIIGHAAVFIFFSVFWNPSWFFFFAAYGRGFIILIYLLYSLLYCVLLVQKPVWIICNKYATLEQTLSLFSCLYRTFLTFKTLRSNQTRGFLCIINKMTKPYKLDFGSLSRSLIPKLCLSSCRKTTTPSMACCSFAPGWRSLV